MMIRQVPFLQLFLSLVLVSLVILGIDSAKLLQIPKQAMGFITNPISFGLYKGSQTIGRQFYFITAGRLAAQRERATQAQMAQLLSENANLRRKLAEAEAELQQQQTLDPKTYNLMSTRPIGLERYLKIDKGSSDGVKVEQAVVFKDNFIGLVVNVSEKSASIRLLSDPDSKIAAFSLNKDGKAKGVLIGQFGSEMLLDKVLHEEKIVIGDLVYSEGTEGFLPRGLILGRITQTLEQENQVFKQAKVKPVFDIRDLELVFIIKE